MDLSILVMILFRILCLYEHRIYMFTYYRVSDSCIFFWKKKNKKQVPQDFQKFNHFQDTQAHVKALIENCWAASQIVILLAIW